MSEPASQPASTEDPAAAEARQLALAFETGDFSGVRVLAARILRDPGAGAERSALARGYLARVQVDRAVWWILGFSALLFCAIVSHYVF